ncbi:LuxR C-terminal-related transcriptional regulator [Rhizobium sp.]|uniref:LuxR C-terminal-related transcriptional regulator n=1 Tax=Rhizobium sp. TaxID=391 RepID=UPI002AA64780
MSISMTCDILIERILSDSRPVIAITAPAGFGKTYILDALAERIARSGIDAGPWTICDHPTIRPNLSFIEKGQRYGIALRPGDTVAGLDRLRLYAQVMDLTGDDLLLTPDILSPQDWDRSAGWPVLLSPGACIRDVASLERQLVTFLADESLADLEEADLCVLATCGDNWPGWLIMRLPPLKYPSTLAYRYIENALPKAVEKLLILRLTDPEMRTDTSGILAQTLLQKPHNLEAVILRLLERKHTFQARTLFCKAGGWFLYYRLGHEAFLRLLSSLEAAGDDDLDELIISRAFVMIKTGDVAWAMQFLVRYFGPEMRDVLTVLSDNSQLSLRVRLFRITVLIYEDVAPTDRLLNALFDIGRDLPLDAPEQRGSFYNAMLEFFLRLRRYEEADGMAEKAMAAYRQADYPILCFYIALHQSVLSLLTSDFNRMGQSLRMAAGMLSNVGFDSPGDQRLLDLVHACMAYENGEPEALLAFLNQDLSGLMEGELWPSLADIAIYYGSHALSVHMSTRAGLRFLERWSVYQPLNRQFRLSLEVRKAQILQNGNGWGDAVRLLTPLSAGFNRVWIESAEEALARLSARNEITLALSWLRQIAYERPTFMHLDRKLEMMLGNSHLLVRQEIATTIWLAFVCRHTQQNSKARNLLRRVFELCASHGGLTALAEEWLFLDHLLQDKRMAEFVMAATPARAILRRLDKGRQSSLAAARTQLTQQELKILMMLAEGASNKLIARNCGITEPTVKFHLKNVYRKLGCARRHEAIATARALGWVR